MERPNRPLALALAVLLAAGCAPAAGPSGEPRTVSARSAAEQRQGDQNHAAIVAQYGGEVSDRELTAYVNGIGRRLVAVTEQPDAKWTFTVLDSAVVNAFALPGGYVYVTRGLLALANDEAELAGVLGHEIGHVTGAHSAGRQQQATIAQLGILGATILGAVAGLPGETINAIGQLGGTVAQGYVASYSREQELEADRLGVRYIARAGWDPRAQAEFLTSLQSETTLQAAIAGQSYNPSRVDFFSTHPATAERVRAAIAAAGAEAAASADAPRNRDRFLAAIDGLVYGDSPEQGFVHGARFAHPGLRFAFEAPQGFRIQNSAAQVVMVGPQGSGIIFDGDSANVAPDAYIARTWAPGLAQNARVGQLSQIRTGKIAGLDAAAALLPAQTNSGVVTLRLTAIRDGDRIWRFMGVQPQGADQLGEVMDGAAASFARLSAAEARALKPQRIAIREVRPGETVAALARMTPFGDRAEERFRVLNGIGPNARLREGRKVKLVVE